MLTIQRETEKLGGACVRGIYVNRVLEARIVKWGRHKWAVQDYNATSSAPHWLDAIACTDTGREKAYETLIDAVNAVQHAWTANIVVDQDVQTSIPEPIDRTRYTELTDTQKAHVDAYINALASGGQTEITHAVKHWAEEARTDLAELENVTENNWRVPPWFVEKTTGAVRHALAMIVDATVRPTLDD